MIYAIVCRQCKAFLRNNLVMEPLLNFLLTNALESPSSDLQWVAARGMELLKTLLKAGWQKILHSTPHSGICLPEKGQFSGMHCIMKHIQGPFERGGERDKVFWTTSTRRTICPLSWLTSHPSNASGNRQFSFRGFPAVQGYKQGVYYNSIIPLP